MYEVDQYTVSLLHFDDGIKDECGNVWTANGGISTSDIQRKEGAKSLYIDGVDDYLLLGSNEGFNFGSSDFTIDGWFNSVAAFEASSNSWQTIISKWDSPSKRSFQIAFGGSTVSGNDGGSGKINFAFSTDGTNFFRIVGSIPSINVWHHFAMVGKSNTIYGFVDGILIGQISGAINNSDAPIVIGRFLNNDNIYNDGSQFNGYIDELRVSKGIARWTSDFDPNAEFKALLVVTMSDEIQKEYDLSMDEINAFITWYDTRATGTGLPHYTFNKDFNLGPFQSRKDYLVFDKIQNFEVMEYTK